MEGGIGERLGEEGLHTIFTVRADQPMSGGNLPQLVYSRGFIDGALPHETGETPCLVPIFLVLGTGDSAPGIE